MKLTLMKEYKKYFTVADMQVVKKIKADSELIAGLDEDIKIATGLGDIIKCSAEICKHEGASIYGDDENGVDILFDILVKKDIFTYEEISIYLTEIWQILGDREDYGFRRIFKMIAE